MNTTTKRGASAHGQVARALAGVDSIEIKVTMKEPPAENPFLSFWEVYPRKEAKRRAEQSFKAACKRASPEMIVAGAKKYADQEARPGQPIHQVASGVAEWGLLGRRAVG